MVHDFTQSINDEDRNQDPIPDICSGNFDAASVIRGEVFIFKGSYVWRLGPKLKLIEGYPTLWKEVFPIFPDDIKRIDAVYERDNDSAIIFFTGRNFYDFLCIIFRFDALIGSTFWVFDGQKLIDNSPQSITKYGVMDNVTQIDAVMIWGNIFERNLSTN